MDFVGGPDRLADLEGDQFANDEIPECERKNERRDRGRDGAKGEVTENVEPFDLLTEEMKIIHHGATSSVRCLFANSSSTRSIRAERLPLTRIKSPGTAVFPSCPAASSAESTATLFSNPASRAALAMPAPAAPTAI